MKWLFDKIVGSLVLHRRRAADAAHRDRDQARQPRAGVLQAEALRLQQRADRGLQVPLDVCRPVRRHRLEAGAEGRSARHPGRRLHPQDLASTSCRSSSTSCSRATCRWSARARTRCTPRPTNRLYDEAVDGYFARHRVKPGITGWAQINGWRGETDTDEKIQRRVEHDLYYIENWSVLFDLYILAKTPLALAKTENAY